MTKIHWGPMFRLLCTSFVISALLQSAGYETLTLFGVSVLVGLVYPETVSTYVKVPQNDDKK